ncbi:MAG TPA: NADH-quinone oxidoreductase subunit NuoK [Planctomycetota bacterium]|nr:NADH-quinone oxidoreductase subunit NuoK [Planctomycetota bacterium]
MIAVVVTPTAVVLVTAVALFGLGIAGLLSRRSPIAMLMSIELMLNAGNLMFVLGGQWHGHAAGIAAATLVLVLGAAEAVVGLALALALFRTRPVADVDTLPPTQASAPTASTAGAPAAEPAEVNA